MRPWRSKARRPARLTSTRSAAIPRLRRRVERLLALDARGERLPRGPASPRDCPRSIRRWLSRARHVIGPYKLMEQIGEGGMGVVYVAEQTQPVRRKVALKIIKPGMDTKQVIARFEAERQALAMMDHPNIAKVLDGGTTEIGRPYFVMELVRGIPITEYCDREQLSIRERLELFVLVCRAVQHAHQKGIIHRDLKPSNILVTLHDGVPVPKVIDFGVAKATGQSLTDKTVYTGLHAARRHAAVHEPRAGRALGPGHRHAQRHLLAGRPALRAADRDDAVRRRDAPARRPSTRCGGSSARRSRRGRARG